MAGPNAKLLTMEVCLAMNRKRAFFCLIITAFLTARVGLRAGNLGPEHDHLRLNELQYIGTHNSYHVAPGQGMAILMNAAKYSSNKEWTSDRLNVALDYTHPSITTQLILGMRQFELDVYADPEGGRFSNPGALRMMQSMPWNLPISFNPDGDLDLPGFKVLHKPEYDFFSTSYLLVEILREIETWSAKHPDHCPIIIHIEAKEGDGKALSEAYEPAVVDDFEQSTWLALEDEICSVIPREKMVTPDSVRGDYASLREAITKRGWPRLKNLRGKFIFLLLNKKDTTHKFMQAFGHSLEHRLFFASLKPDHPWASWFRVPDPNYKYIPQFIEQGFLVTSMADKHTYHARANNTEMRDKAFEVGAHFILTDFPIPDRRFSDFQVIFENNAYIRKNPLAH